MSLQTIKQVVNHKLCIGCGLCELDDRVKMVEYGGMYSPDLIPESSAIEASCPSKGYDLKNLGHDLFGDAHYCAEIGYYRKILLAHTRRETLLKKASSGGMITEVALNLLSKGLVDGVITTRFTIENNKVRAQTYIAKSEQELIDGQGSKYCPTSTLAVLKQLDLSRRYLLIGTPCQIAGFRLYSEHNTLLKTTVPYTIANFCGGYRDYRELDYFISEIAHIKDVETFRHRGGGQPGSMRIEGKNGEVFQYPYPDYARISPFVKNERCTLCMDATGELADFSCGDAWLENRDKSHPWSIILGRSEFASQFLEEMVGEGGISIDEKIDAKMVIESQRSNITSKKYRQNKRIKARNSLLMYSPCWKEANEFTGGNYMGELRIILSKLKAKWLHKH